MKELTSIVEDSNTNYLFSLVYGNKMDRDKVINNFAQYGKQAGIKQRFTPHIFHATLAVNFIKNCGDSFTLQRILCHSTLEMTRRYIQLTNTDLISKHKEAS